MKTPFLKPCPFCGGKASIFQVEQPDGGITYEVDCENPDCAVCCCTDLYSSKLEAIGVWNRRAHED